MNESRSKSLKSSFFTKSVLALLVMVALAIPSNGFANSNSTSATASKISGIVKDITGEPIIAATVVVKEKPSVGTITKDDGSYSITASEGQTLVFSYFGYATQEVKVSKSKVINVTLKEDVKVIDEVVVVGYGTQKKLNLTGSVTTISSDKLVSRPVTNSAALLQGRVAGLNITQSSGQPGAENVSISLHGVGSFGSTAPLVLIDGFEGGFSEVNPQDIENITVLKDAASAAIYGAKAANGVILITTKSGKSTDLKVNYVANIGIQNAARLPDFIYDSVEYMEMWNKGAAHTGLNTVYSQDMIDSYKNAAPGDPRYPNFNWLDYMFNPAVRQEYQVSAYGGNDKLTAYANAGYISQDGIIDGYGEKSYSTRLNLDMKVNNLFSLGFKNGVMYTDTSAPTAGSISEMMLYIYTMPPTMSPYLADGSGHLSARDINPNIWRNRNPVAMQQNEGKTRTQNYKVTPQAYLNITPFKGLEWKTSASWRYDRTEYSKGNFPIEGYYFATNEYWGDFEADVPGMSKSTSYSSTLTFNSIASYKKSFGSHNFNLLAGYEQQEMNYDTKSIYRKDYLSSTTTDIDAGSAEGQDVGGYTSSWSFQSLFGRLAYDYQGKYLFEGNLRYDGSSKLAPGHRYQFFPSVSVGWRLSEEKFMKGCSWLDNLKIRFSAGTLGNVNSLGDYPYQSLLSTASYPVNGSLQTGVISNTLSNPELTWEKLTSYNLGVDFSIFNKLFSIEADVYKRITKGGIVTAQIPNSVGKYAPKENYRNMQNIGLDLSISHQNHIGDLNYNATILFDLYKNKITRMGENSWGTQSSVEGHAINEYYMLKWTGIYQNQKMVDELPMYEPYRGQTKPGDLIFYDRNGDGTITTEKETGDKVFVNGYHPKFSYSFSAGADYKGFDFSMFWQGVYGKYRTASWIGFDPFLQGGPVTKRWRNAWDGEGSTNSMPALANLAQTYSYAPIYGQMSTFRLYNVSYLRLKNLQIGYTIPKSIAKKIKADKIRAYISGDNLLTISPFDYDPEGGQSSNTTNAYPLVKTYTFGLNVTF